jgi:hypothetical protein
LRVEEKTMTIKDNVAALCRSRGLQNPVQEDCLKIARLIFKWRAGDGSITTLEVEGTDMNRAGRLYVEEQASGLSGVVISALIRARAAEFFTPELWDDCSSERRTLVYGMKTASMVEIIYKAR